MAVMAAQTKSTAYEAYRRNSGAKYTTPSKDKDIDASTRVTSLTGTNLVGKLCRGVNRNP